ncbi:MAG: ArsC family reductase [Candidatus Thiodiazotropha sp. L084R]
MVRIYGIPNCDTIKKARQWLSDNEIDYEFHDYKKAGIDETMLKPWIKSLGWEALLNKRSTSWRQLDEQIKSNLSEKTAIEVMLQTPSIIKRPLLDDGENLYLGFKAEQYSQIFS